jgi:VanZ family protein
MQQAKAVSLKKFTPGIIWFVVVLVLIWLPGKDLPESEFLFKIDFDKFVHVGMFGLLTLLFCWPFYKTDVPRQKLIRYFIIIALLASAFGYGCELIQKYWAEGRSYDLMDWIADSVGALAAYIFCRKFFIQKK